MMSRSHGWVAALLSVLMPGLGHLYAGRALRAIAAFILLQVLGFGLVYLTLVASTAPLRVVLIVLLLAGFLAVVLDAARVARRDIGASPQGATVVRPAAGLPWCRFHRATLDLRSHEAPHRGSPPVSRWFDGADDLAG